MTLEFTELGTSDDVYLLLGVGLKVCISNVGCPGLAVVEFCEEGEDANASELDYAGIDGVNRRFCEVTSSNIP